MITINATGDTTLHTAGKYCPEDILVKVPAGGSGGSTVETGDITVSDLGMYEPGVNEYVLSSEKLHTSERLHIVIYGVDSSSYNVVLMMLARETLDSEFVIYAGYIGSQFVEYLVIEENSITLYTPEIDTFNLKFITI